MAYFKIRHFRKRGNFFFITSQLHIFASLIVFSFSDNLSMVSAFLISSAHQPVVFARLPTWVCIVPLSTFDSLALSRFVKNDWGVFGERRTKTFVSSYIATINGNILLVSCAERMGMWIGVFGGGIKEMLSKLNEGRFTQYNEGWTHGFTADVYLKRPGKYCFGTEGFICRYTYPLQPLAPTWGPELSSGSLLFLFFFLSERVEKCETSSV